MSNNNTLAIKRPFLTSRPVTASTRPHIGVTADQVGSGSVSNILLLKAPIREGTSASSEERIMFSAIRELPAKQRAKLKVHIEDLQAEAEHERAVKAAARQAARSLSRAWDNPDDARYNDL